MISQVCIPLLFHVHSSWYTGGILNAIHHLGNSAIATSCHIRKSLSQVKIWQFNWSLKLQLRTQKRLQPQFSCLFFRQLFSNYGNFYVINSKHFTSHLIDQRRWAQHHQCKKKGIVILPGNTELSPVVFLSMRRGVLTMFDSSHSTQKIWAANVRKGAIGEYSIRIISLWSTGSLEREPSALADTSVLHAARQLLEYSSSPLPK